MKDRNHHRLYVMNEADGQRLIALAAALSRALEAILYARSVDFDAYDCDHDELTVHELAHLIQVDSEDQ